MKYKMYYEMLEQPESLRKTFESEFSKIDEASQLVSDVDKVYLIGCGSSISTCYSVRDAIRMSSTNIMSIFVLLLMYFEYSRFSSSLIAPSGSERSCEKPMIALSGVRISWLMF